MLEICTTDGSKLLLPASTAVLDAAARIGFRNKGRTTALPQGVCIQLDGAEIKVTSATVSFCEIGVPPGSKFAAFTVDAVVGLMGGMDQHISGTGDANASSAQRSERVVAKTVFGIQWQRDSDTNQCVRCSC